MKLNSFNAVTIIGYVTNFKILESKGKKRADIGIKDELNNNICYCTLFESDKLKYDNNPITINGLKSIFLTSDDKPRHVLVKAKGTVSENAYVNAGGSQVVDTKPLVFYINPESNPDNQGIVFMLRGVVEGMKEVNDGEDLRIRLGTLSLDRNKVPNKITYNTLVASGEIKDKLEDFGIEKYSQIDIAGDILNINERDKYGSTGRAIKEMRIMRVNKVTSSDDIDDFESIYMVLKKGGTVDASVLNDNKDDEDAEKGLPFNNPSKKVEELNKINNDDDDELDF